MHAASRIALTGFKTASAAGPISYRTIVQAASTASAPAQGASNGFSSKRRRPAELPADPHTSTFRAGQPLETRTLKTTQEAAATPAEPKSLDRFGFQAMKNRLRNYVAGPLYAQ